MCNEVIIKEPTTPHMHHYSTLWNVNVRKLATTWKKCLV